jgi:hypothetical protein
MQRHGRRLPCGPDPAFVCRPSSGACDPEETCSDASAACPADVGEPDGDNDGVCDSIDACPQQSDPAQADGDADGLGDACDPCSNIVPVFASRSQIRIKGLDTPPGDDGFVFKGQMTVPTTPPIDPATKGIRLLLDDAGANVLDVVVPGGAGWKTSRSGNSWRFKNPSGPSGIVKVSLKRRAKAPGTLKFGVLGRAGSLAVTRARIPVKGTLVVDAPMARTGQCGETQYGGAGCEFSRSGRSLRCR